MESSAFPMKPFLCHQVEVLIKTFVFSSRSAPLLATAVRARFSGDILLSCLSKVLWYVARISVSTVISGVLDTLSEKNICYAEEWPLPLIEIKTDGNPISWLSWTSKSLPRWQWASHLHWVSKSLFRQQQQYVSNTLATYCKEPNYWKRPGSWERLRARGEEGHRG